MSIIYIINVICYKFNYGSFVSSSLFPLKHILLEKIEKHNEKNENN